MEQLETIAEPFHRMFSLDNIAIQYPYAVIERVPTGESFASGFVSDMMADLRA